jgi:hypothetical protein
VRTLSLKTCIFCARNTPELLLKTDLYNSSSNRYELVSYSTCLLERTASCITTHYRAIILAARSSFTYRKDVHNFWKEILIPVFTRSRHGTLSQLNIPYSLLNKHLVDTNLSSTPRSPKNFFHTFLLNYFIVSYFPNG